MKVNQVVVDGVTISGRAWFKLATLAENRGLTVADLIAKGMEAMVSTTARPEGSKYGRTTTPMERRKMTPRRQARCRELYALGYPDPHIAYGIGMDVAAVKAWREKEQLPPHDRLAADHPNPKAINK